MSSSGILTVFLDELKNYRLAFDGDDHAREIGILKGHGAPPARKPLSRMPPPDSDRWNWEEWLHDNLFSGFDDSGIVHDGIGQIRVFQSRADATPILTVTFDAEVGDGDTEEG
jgi:hypothetical protein